MSQETDVHMAVTMLQQSMLKAIMDRQTAVEALIPDVVDRNSVVMTAATLNLGILLAYVAPDSASFQDGIRRTVKILRDSEDQCRKMMAAAMKQYRESQR